MDKFFEQDRRNTAEGFEIIDLSADRVESLRRHLRIDTPLHVQWNNWEYGVEIAELRALYEKGKRNQWNASDDIDWSIPLSRDQWLGNPDSSLLAFLVGARGGSEEEQKSAMFDEVNFMLSNLLHGEQAALQLCGQLTALCPTTDEKLYAANQANDEARHTEVIARLLSEKMGTIHPIGVIGKVLLEELLSADTYYKKTLGMQTLFEGFAMGMLDGLRTSMHNPLLVEIVRRVQIDESRHAAFGLFVMRRMLRQISQQEKNELEDWSLSILEAVNAEQGLVMLRAFGPKYGLDPEQMVEALQYSDEWKTSNASVFMHTVIPNLLRLGLITERTEQRYRELRMLTDSPQLVAEKPDNLPHYHATPGRGRS